MIERYSEMHKRRHRRHKVKKLLKRLDKAKGDERKQLVEKLTRVAPWRQAEFQQRGA
jgi:hypothetical protein